MGYFQISLTLSRISIFKLHFLENLDETLFYIFDLNCSFFQVESPPCWSYRCCWNNLYSGEIVRYLTVIKENSKGYK